MNRTERYQLLWGTLGSILVVGLFVVWADIDKESLHHWTKEDGPLQNTTSILFGLSSICFVAIAFRSDFIKEKRTGPTYLMTVAWALLMFIFMGEEISWGQRIFGFATPESLSAINGQNETNIHNIVFVDTFLGGKYRYLSIMMLLTGLFIPLFSLTNLGKHLVQWWAFPVSPLMYWFLFVGAYIYGKIYREFTFSTNDAAEVRELLMSIAMFCFALHGAIRPCRVFRNCPSKLTAEYPQQPKASANTNWQNVDSVAGSARGRQRRAANALRGLSPTGPAAAPFRNACPCGACGESAAGRSPGR